MPLEVRQETQCPLPVTTVILGYPSIFKRSQELSLFEPFKSACLLSSPKDVSSSVEMRCGPRAYSRVYTGDSDIPSPWEMKDEPASSHCREIQHVASWHSS